MRSMLMLLVGFGLIASVVSAGGSSLADAYNRRASLQRDADFVQMFSPARGDLRNQASTTWYVTLQAGTEYKIFGACDEDCADLDLELRDESGRLLAEDSEDDDYPIVSVRPRFTQEYAFKVTMADCWRAPCGYMVGVFGR